MTLLATVGLFLTLKGTFDPVQTLTEIRTFQNLQYSEAQKSKSQDAFELARTKVKAKVEEVLKDVKPEEVDARNSLPLAQIYAVGEMWAPALGAIEKFLSAAESGEAFMGESLAIQYSTRAKKVDSLIAHTTAIKFVSGQQAAGFAGNWMNAPFNLLLETKSLEVAVQTAEQLEARMLEIPNLDVESKTTIRATFAEYLAEVLGEAGKKDAAIQKIDSALPLLDDKSGRGMKMLKTRLLLVGNPAPELIFAKGYGTYTKESLVGKVVLVDFFAHWCGPCKAGFPEMRKLYSELKPKGLEIVSVTKYYGYFNAEGREKRDMPADIEFGKMEGFIKEFELPWTVQYGDAENFTKYGVTSIPTLVVIDKKGIVRKLRIGYDPASIGAFKKELENLLSE